MESSGKDWLVLAGLCVLGVFLGRMQDGARSKDGVDFLGDLIQSSVRPAAGALSSGLNGLADTWEGITSGDDLVRRNRRLEQQVRAASLYDANVMRLQAEVDSLRRMLDLPVIGARDKVAADVIGYFPRENRITISAGSNTGIRSGSPVITGDGLVGVVSSVSGNQSQVVLLGNSRLQIGGITSSATPAAGLLRGESSQSLLLEIPEMSARVAVGETVQTTGFSEKIPKGIVIGTVVSVEDEIQFGRKVARVKPSVQVAGIREVLVLR